MKLSIPLSSLSRGRLRAVLEVALCLALLLAGWLWSADMRAGRNLARQTAAAPAGFPRTVHDHAGDALRLPRPPSRIASQALVSDHFLFAVVDRSRIAAVSAVAHDRRYSYVADVVDGMDVAVAGEPEALLRRRPDLLIASNTARADYVALARGAGIPTFRLLTVYEDFAQIAEGLETVGRLTGEEPAAERVIRRFRDRIAAAVARRPAGAPPPRVLVYVAFSGTFGAGSLFDHILTELGAVNVAAEQGIGPHGAIGTEQIAAWNPDWIIADAPAGEEAAVRRRLLDHPAVAVTAAGRAGQVLVIDHRQFITMSQYAAGLTETVAAALYPDAP